MHLTIEQDGTSTVGIAIRWLYGHYDEDARPLFFFFFFFFSSSLESYGFFYGLELAKTDEV